MPSHELEITMDAHPEDTHPAPVPVGPSPAPRPNLWGTPNLETQPEVLDQTQPQFDTMVAVLYLCPAMQNRIRQLAYLDVITITPDGLGCGATRAPHHRDVQNERVNNF